MSSVDPNLINPTDICSVCQKLVAKIFTKFHKAGTASESKKRRKYVDETGRLWHGTKCPECSVKWRKDRAQKQAALKQAELKKKLEE